MKLSVITINYNNRDGLLRTKESLMIQVFTDWEWIIIDGGSTDGSMDVISDVQNKIAFSCSEKDNGVYNAMNKGICHAHGEYILFLNSGDSLHSEKTLSCVFRYQISSDIIYGDWCQITGNKVRKVKGPEYADTIFFLSDNICHQAMFIKAHCFAEGGYDEKYKLYADWAKWLELSIKGYTFEHIPAIICDYDMCGMSAMQKERAKIERYMLRNEPVPEHFLNTKKLSEYEKEWFLREALSLIHQRKICKKIIRRAVKIARFINKVLPRTEDE